MCHDGAKGAQGIVALLGLDPGATVSVPTTSTHAVTATMVVDGNPCTAAPLGQALGAESALAADVAGDLAEKYALRAADDGTGGAQCWYAREALRDGPPARLLAGAGDVANRVVVSTTEPVSIPMRVLDAAGAVLRRTDVRYTTSWSAPRRRSCASAASAWTAGR